MVIEIKQNTGTRSSDSLNYIYQSSRGKCVTRAANSNAKVTFLLSTGF